MDSAETIAIEQQLEIPTYDKMPMALVRGEGPYVWDAEGTRYLDFYGGHCVSLLGHCHPNVVAAVQAQAEQLIFYSNVAHSPVRARAARRLADLAPDGLGNVFFANSGSEANETALKLARTYTGRSGVVAMEQGWHGRTLGSLATTHDETYRAPYADVLPETTWVPVGDLDAAEAVLSSEEIAAVLLEPIQSIAGMRAMPADYVQGLRALCDATGTLLIFDEVQTGVGRTGTFSMSTPLGATPDLIALAKSLGAGVPVSAVLVDDAVAAAVEPGDQGSTFGGGMLAMAAVEATLRTLVEDDLMARATDIHTQVAEAVGPVVEEVRGRGCLMGLKLNRPAEPVIDALRDQNVLVGGSSDPHVMRLMPPLVVSDDDVTAFAEALHAALDATSAPARAH
ncbi:aspartate aminotransferase family protein [Salinibacter ruber]|uniref:Acetylornithine aminotransferase/acetylornithine/N-succinyldiaminopimelate aminotransferase n=1 Tax=Salinibacter ruber TaxID=146919 RepID=A0A9X2PZY7_9BACT|nr:aspartate aminotransferase family protein [Salinibacter ruber]MBB4068858.1 acetylornithine aminotransferase/acetylornithine/N-succinyldiaminopimelate aminotransferase [Salinibacter ruber]MCS3646180.1 acetylornithine aminotransferase/acetylornithine/N-succinyldiaminopimelate aminotransferase [Salinibacter ruber]MCS3658857.1 acetylornithine aminotransferase/acetylornithine/N-succinyldiaminopimelate aminotransferase [Salinibacter ruber]MCS3708661.1 acetylornithine aminotransferase/acetylornithi